MQEDKKTEVLSALDWIAAVLALFGVIFCVQFPFLIASDFKPMFEEIGGTLPAITVLSLSTWFPILLGLVPAVILATALLSRFTLARRRALIVAAFCLGFLSSCLCTYALYAPLFAVAGSVSK